MVRTTLADYRARAEFEDDALFAVFGASSALLFATLPKYRVLIRYIRYLGSVERKSERRNAFYSYSSRMWSLVVSCSTANSSEDGDGAKVATVVCLREFVRVARRVSI